MSSGEEAKQYQKDRRARLHAEGLCTNCGKQPPKKDGKWCEDCRSVGRERNARKADRARETAKGLRVRRRAAVLAAYGNVCACCAESDPRFLTIDHIAGGGRQHRKVHKNDLDRWLIDHDFPDDFRILCFNCNCGRERNGGVCPHEEERAEVVPLRAVA